MCQKKVIDHQQREMYIVAIMATKLEFLITKDEMLVGCNFEPWNGFEITMPVLSMQPCKRKEPNWPFFIFLEAIPDSKRKLCYKYW